MSVLVHRRWIVLLGLVAAAACRGPAHPGPAPGPGPAAKAPEVAASENLLLDVTDVIWNQRHLDRLGEYYAADVVRHVPEKREPITGLDANREYIAAMQKAFPDLQVSTPRVIADGSWAAAEWVFAGHQKGDLPGVPATGRPVRLPGVSIVRIADGKVVEIWDYDDRLLLLYQLGVRPPAPPQ